MNLFDLSKVITECTLECCNKDIFPSDVKVFLKNEDGSVSHVHCCQFLFSEKLNIFFLVLSDDTI